MQNPLQPLFSLNVNNKDVTKHIDGQVTYDERADMINTLTFTLKNGAEFMEIIKPGSRVVMTGGSFMETRQIFSGVVKRIRGVFPDEGNVKATFECFDSSWGTALTEKRVGVYPQKEGIRSWADKSTITVSEIVRNIANEMGAELDIQLPDGADIQYSLLKPVAQDKMTDWSLLRLLAKRTGCVLFNDMVNAKLVLRFIDKSKVANYASPISFLYPIRKGNEFVFDTSKSNQIVLRSLNVEEDFQAADANVRMVSKFDDETGQEISLISRTEERDGKKYIYYYQLDEAKVQALEDNNPGEADRLRGMGALNIPYEEFIKYYTVKEYVEEDIAVWSHAFLGITVSAESYGNINIKSQRAYDIYGISRYSTDRLHGKFYLRAMKMIWDGGTFTNEYEFIR